MPLRFPPASPFMWTTLAILVSQAVPCALTAQQPSDTGAAGPRPQCLFSPTPECIFRLDELTERPQLIQHPLPKYPARLVRNKVQGTVRLLATLDTTGRVEPGSVVVLSTPDSELGATAGRELLSSVYKPGRVYGRPVRVRFVLPIEYSLPR